MIQWIRCQNGELIDTRYIAQLYVECDYGWEVKARFNYTTKDRRIAWFLQEDEAKKFAAELAVKLSARELIEVPPEPTMSGL